MEFISKTLIELVNNIKEKSKDENVKEAEEAVLSIEELISQNKADNN